MDRSKSSKLAPKILIADDDPCVLRAVADRCTRMGFQVETAASGLQALIKASQHRPDVLVIDVHMPEVDGLSVLAYLPDIAKKSLHVMVVTGNPGQEIAERCEGFDASCIQKGHNFWNEFEASLTAIYPQRADAIRKSGKQSERIEVKQRPRILLVDDDINVKKFLFREFDKLGAELLYAVDGNRGFWMARREEPTVIVAVNGRPLHDASGAISGGALVFHDITAARETERKLHQSQKLDAIGKLTGGVAHDFNNMLTVIAGTTEILVADLHDKPDLQAVAKLINRATDRCTELIQQLLAFARKQPLQPRDVDINGSIFDISKLLRPTLGEQIEIESKLQRGMPTALVDPSQLANALINLAINARDAMPGGGKLMLDADVRPGAYVMIAVTDTGTGMPAEIRDKVFEPFFTTKEAGKGTGLGLSMVHGFVKQSGGHIKIYSEEGHGTSIKLYLPAASGRAEAFVPMVEPARGAGETILVVEDDALVRGFVIAQLHNLGYRTAAAADGRAALEYVESGQPFDLLFTDVVMPGGITGRQLADEVGRRQPGTRVLYTSGYTENSIVHQGRLDQGVMLLSKPYRKSELAGIVRLALGDGIAKNLETGSIPLADTSSEVRKLRRDAAGAALSSD